MTKPRFDLAIIGSGFTGSLIAMAARQLGRSVVLIDRETHPRFAIGESSTPLANFFLERVAQRYALPELLPFTNWGDWQRHHPEIPCGLKRGFSFFHHQAHVPFSDDTSHQRQLLVAASPRDDLADTHWYRPAFDHFLAQRAQARGAELLQATAVLGLSQHGCETELELKQKANCFSIRARFLIDASGPRGCLFRYFQLGEQPLPSMPLTDGLFTHFRNVASLHDLPSYQQPQNTPFPIDAAAEHHVFDGGWVWVLRFNNGITSAGVAARKDLAHACRFHDGAAGWSNLLGRFPSLAAQFQHAQADLPFRYVPSLPFLAQNFTGPNWLLVPSAAGFVDPLLSTGFPLSLLGVLRILRALEEGDWTSASFTQQLSQYAAQTKDELQRVSCLVGALYSTMGNFEAFRALTHLYFAAASYSEILYRVEQRDEYSFLLGDTPFGKSLPALLEQLSALSANATELQKRVRTLIEPINIAGLADDGRNHWYPVLMEDLLKNSHKLGLARGELIQRLPALFSEVRKEPK